MFQRGLGSGSLRPEMPRPVSFNQEVVRSIRTGLTKQKQGLTS